jgi:hypothetical protein
MEGRKECVREQRGTKRVRERRNGRRVLEDVTGGRVEKGGGG